MKTKTVKRSRLVPHTVDGHTEMVHDRYEVELPTPPRDWDHIVLTAATAGAGLLLIVCIVWTTASVGDLLARVVHPAAAYGAALAFDLAWIICLALEWLARYDSRRAALPRTAGYVALAVAMAAVAAHGILAGGTGAIVIGLVGAAVSGIVKGVWTVVLGHHAKPLDDKTQQWVDKQRAAAGGELAMIPVRRQLTRARGQVEAERIAIGAEEPPAIEADEEADEFEDPAALPPSTELRGPAGTPVKDLSTLRHLHGPIVYFLGNGGRVKIGTSQNVASRISTLCLRFEDLLCAFHGAHDIERRFHSLFAPYRVGSSEWFEIKGELAAFIALHSSGASLDAAPASPDADGDADDAALDAGQDDEPQQPVWALPPGGNKTQLILSASAQLAPGASASEIAHFLARHGHAVDTAYIRTILSRNKPKPTDGQVGKGGGGYA